MVEVAGLRARSFTRTEGGVFDARKVSILRTGGERLTHGGEYLLTMQHSGRFVAAILLFWPVKLYQAGFFCGRIEAVFHRVRNGKSPFQNSLYNWSLVATRCWHLAGSGSYFLFFNL